MAHLDPRYPFCSEDIGRIRTNRGRHIGRHMEEIAFAVVTKPYEEWDFYSSPSERHLDDPSLSTAVSWYSEPTWYPCICYDCRLELHTVVERAKHFVSIHGLSVAAAQAQFGGGYQCHHSSNLGQRPCNNIYSSPMDLNTHQFDYHTEGRRLLCVECTQIYERKGICLVRYYVVKEQVLCGICGDPVPSYEAREILWADFSKR